MRYGFLPGTMVPRFIVGCLPQGQKIIRIGPIGEIHITRKEGDEGAEIFVVNSSLGTQHVLCGPLVLGDIAYGRYEPLP